LQSDGTAGNNDLHVFIVGCALLTLTLGVGLRAVQIRQFISDDLAQVPAYGGTGRHVVIIDTRFSSYGADLVQNDPWMRGSVIRMLSHGTVEDAIMMRAYFPEMRRIQANRYGTVWSVGAGSVPGHANTDGPQAADRR
jgi:hypothetical protein